MDCDVLLPIVTFTWRDFSGASTPANACPLSFPGHSSLFCYNYGKFTQHAHRASPLLSPPPPSTPVSPSAGL